MQDIYIVLVLAVHQCYMTSTHLYVLGPGSIPSWHPFGDPSSGGSCEEIGEGLGNFNMFIF
jgi:hypothetical protein